MYTLPSFIIFAICIHSSPKLDFCFASYADLPDFILGWLIQENTVGMLELFLFGSDFLGFFSSCGFWGFLGVDTKRR